VAIATRETVLALGLMRWPSTAAAPGCCFAFLSPFFATLLLSDFGSLLAPFFLGRRKMTQSDPLDLPRLEARASDLPFLSAQWESVPLNEAFPDEIPAGVEAKNISVRFLPNIHSRVYLSVDLQSADHAQEEYINANFITDEHSYVLTQAPQAATAEVRPLPGMPTAAWLN
jgi:hypothetical protein